MHTISIAEPRESGLVSFSEMRPIEFGVVVSSYTNFYDGHLVFKSRGGDRVIDLTNGGCWSDPYQNNAFKVRPFPVGTEIKITV